MLKQIDSMLLQHRGCVSLRSLDMQLLSASQLSMQKSARQAPSTHAAFRGHLASRSCAKQDQPSRTNRRVRRGLQTSVVANARDAPTSSIYDLPSFSEDTARLCDSAVTFLRQQSTDQVATETFAKNIQNVKFTLQALGQSGTGYEIANAVCQLQRLGVDGYFRNEIPALLENLYRRWKSMDSDHKANVATNTDLEFTAVTFSLLRSYGSDVTPEPLIDFVKNGKLLGDGVPHEDGDSRVAGILHLKRATDFVFPGEDIFSDVRRSAIETLTHTLENNSQIPRSLSSEIQHELVYHWYRKIPMVETLQYLKIYNDGDPWAGSSAIRNLAIENLSFWQPRLLQEAEITDRWNKETRIPELPFVRDVAELLTLVMMSGIPEPQYRVTRLAMVKLGTIGYVIDDLFDEHASLEELRIFTECIRRWDPSLPKSFPEPVKVIYKATWETTNDLAEQATVVQGRDLHPYFQKVIAKFVDSQLVEAEWAATKYEPRFDEYMENGQISVAIYSSTSLAVFFRVWLWEEQVEHEDYIKLFHLMTYVGRLMNDIDGYKRDKTFDGQSNVVGIIIRESDGTMGEAEAMDKTIKMVEKATTELLQLLLSSSSIPADAKGLFLMSIRFSLLSTDTSHPFAKCLQGRPEQLPDNTRSWSAPVLREFNKQLQEISLLSLG